MRKWIIIALAAAVSLTSLAAVKVKFDKATESGRIVSVSGKTFTNGFLDKKDPVNISIGAIVPKGGAETAYGITLAIHGRGEKVLANSTLLIKTGKGEVIEGKTSIEYSDDIGRYDTFTKSREYVIYPRFDVTHDDLEAIARDGIAKIRTQCADGYKENEFSGKKLKQTAEYFAEALKVLDGALESGQNAKDIHDDF